MKKSEEKWLQNKNFYPHAIWDAWYTHRWHMERNLGFVATCQHFFTFLHNSEEWRKIKKSEENGEKKKKSEENKEKWRKWRKISKNEEKKEKWRNMKKQEEK